MVQTSRDTVIHCGSGQHHSEEQQNDDGHGGHKRSVGHRFRLRRIARRHRKDPNRQQYVAAIKRKIRQDYSLGAQGSWERRRDDAFIFSVSIFDWLTPSPHPRGLLWATPIFVTLILVVFAFMAGAYPFYQLEEGVSRHVASMGWDPKELFSFIKVKGIASRKFDFNFLLNWGGRYLPRIERGETYRWFSSLLIHQSYRHLLSNGIILVYLGGLLERKYGGLRLLAIGVLSGLGGNLLSGLMESQCSMVVGTSGIVFGLIGLTIADMAIERGAGHSVSARALSGLIVLGFFILTLVLEDYSSHVSHVGGFVCGVVPSMLFLQSLKNERVEAGTVWGVVGFLLLFFTMVPAVLSVHVLPNLSCTA